MTAAASFNKRINLGTMPGILVKVRARQVYPQVDMKSKDLRPVCLKDLHDWFMSFLPTIKKK